MPSGISVISWSIPNPTAPITVLLSNAFLKPHELVFKVEESLPVDVQNTSLDVNITNSYMDVNVTNSVLPVDIQNSSIVVEQATSSVWDINVTNSTLDVNVNGTASVSIDSATVTVDTLSFKEKNYSGNGLVPISATVTDSSTTKTYTNTGTKNAYLFDCVTSLEGSSPAAGKIEIKLYDDTDTLQAVIFKAQLEITSYYESTFAQKHFDPPITIPPGWYVTMYVWASSSTTTFGLMTILEEV
ncbi:MAG: hypothetical protein H0Z19_11645 [Archaeoglobus sp.]|uniref:hypothetical protein n=1 Tax=Archaeoglobus sp. TaxID=1872626 RepID=UPI001DA83CD4|nr:hypothetical protein [Archaeoglobus sp.]MBO8181101.1 hypothetical protein [Archaeoglobus sp.]